MYKTTNDDQQDLLTLSDFMSALQVGRTTAYHLLNSGEVKSFKIGRYHKIPRAAVAEYISRMSDLGFYGK